MSRSQEKILEELKRMEVALGRLSKFKQIPRLTAYVERVKQCKKRIDNVGTSIGVIQERIEKFNYLLNYWYF